MPIPFGNHYLGIVPDLNAIVALNEVAAWVWSAIADGLSQELATRRLAAEHPERAAHATEDVAACIAVWREAGLFERPADVAAQADEPTDPALPAAFRCIIGGPGGSAHVCVEAEDTAAIARDMLQDFPASPLA
jgi:hypothetical protein